jgi:hypothetical protein
MDMSAAALPARYGKASEQDRKHPLFVLYQQYRSSMSVNLVNSEDFKDWLFCYEQNLVRENVAKHDKYPDFMKWMVQNQGGARRCPAGSFPHNFNYWLDGGHW